MNIVIADDEQIMLRWLKKNLEELSPEFHVTEVCMNGKQVLNCCLNKKVDVLFTDIRMPVMDGLELLEKLKANKIMPYTVILSAYSDFSYVRDAFKMGASDYLMKTEITKESLKQCLDNAQNWLEENNGQDEPGSDLDYSVIPALEQYFFDSSQGACMNWDQYEAQFREICGEQYRIILLRSYGAAFHLEQVKEIIAMLFDEKQQRVQVVCKNANEIVLLLESRQKKDIASIIGFRDYLAAFGMKKVLLGISDVSTGIKELEKTWCQVRQMEAEMQFYGQIGIIHPYMAEEKQKNAEQELEKLCAKVLECVENGTPEQVNELAEKLILYVCKARPSAGMMKQKLIDLLLHIYWNRISEEQRNRLKTSAIFSLNDAKNIQEFQAVYLEQLGILKLFLDENRNLKMYSDSVGKVIEYISENYSRDISLNDLAGYVHLNRSYLSTCFKKEVGENINVFLLNYRLERAKELLTSTNEQVQQICDKVGIPDSAYFSKQFKKYTGESPLEYRKMHK